MKKVLAIAILAAALTPAFAASEASVASLATGARVGLGQDSATGPVLLKNLQLSDPLIQKKYLNEPDLLRFLRGTYSEACARGMLNQTTKDVAADLKGEQPAANRAAAKRLLDSKRMWKLTSFEMEAIFGSGYLTASNYCDCLMKEVPDFDLVNPKKGKEVVDQLPQSVQRSCEMTAKEQTDRQLKTAPSSKK